VSGSRAVARKKYTLTDLGRMGRAEANRRRSRPVICLSNGQCYRSATAAAYDINASVSALIHSIRRKGACRGLRFNYLDAYGPPPGAIAGKIEPGGKIWV
jgi:hypothetical protein